MSGAYASKSGRKRICGRVCGWESDWREQACASTVLTHVGGRMIRMGVRFAD